MDMIVLHCVVLVLLCAIILLNVTLPSSIRSLGVVPVTITLLFMVMYLFTHSPLLGIVGLVAAYTLMQTSTSRSIPTLPTDADFTPTNQFQETLEEYPENNENNENNKNNKNNENNENNKNNEKLKIREIPEINEIIICPSCNKEQLKIIIVTICEAKDSIWYKCSETKTCPLFQNKTK